MGNFREHQLNITYKVLPTVVAVKWTHFQGMRYKFFKGLKTLKEANKVCQQEQAQLVSIHNAVENKFSSSVYNLLATFS